MEKTTKKAFIEALTANKSEFFYNGYWKNTDKDFELITNFAESYTNDPGDLRTATGNNYKITFSNGSALDFHQVGKYEFYRCKDFMILRHITPDQERHQFLLYRIVK